MKHSTFNIQRRTFAAQPVGGKLRAPVPSPRDAGAGEDHPELSAPVNRGGGHPACRRGRASRRPERSRVMQCALEKNKRCWLVTPPSAGLEATALRQAGMPAATGERTTATVCLPLRA